MMQPVIPLLLSINNTRIVDIFEFNFKTKISFELFMYFKIKMDDPSFVFIFIQPKNWSY